MSASKSRGSKEERVAQALGLQKKNLNELRKEHGLPEDSIFCGYLVHIPSSDEFLHKFEDSNHAIKRTFAKTPELGLRFENFIDAHKLAREDKGEIVVGMFDLGKQYLVYPITGSF